MRSLLIFVLSFTFVCAILIEVHCRLQLKLIIKPRTKLNLVIHYSIFIPYVCCIILYLLKVQDITQSFGNKGIRRTELSLLYVNDVDLKQGLLRVNHGKGNKERIIPISPCL